jgi:DNA-binding transcriptional MerR regulator
MALKKINKLYYSIGEVSKITNLKQYVLRYWETEFSVLNPSKNTAGNRIYKDKDIVLIKYIQDLLYKEKFTIKGAKLHLKKEFSSQETLKIKTVNEDTIVSKDDLLNIRKSLTDIIALVDTYKD